MLGDLEERGKREHVGFFLRHAGSVVMSGFLTSSVTEDKA